MLFTRSATMFLVTLFLLTGCASRTQENLKASNNWTIQHKTKNLIVGVSINPPTAAHNAVFITVRNLAGEPVSDAVVSITSLKQWMFDNQKDMQARYVAKGTYRVDTDMSDGTSELNIAITPRNEKTTHLRTEAEIARPLAANHSFLLIQ